MPLSQQLALGGGSPAAVWAALQRSLEQCCGQCAGCRRLPAERICHVPPPIAELIVAPGQPPHTGPAAVVGLALLMSTLESALRGALGHDYAKRLLMIELLQDAATLRLLGPEAQPVLLLLFGTPRSLNIRNLVWHGFVSHADQLPPLVLLVALLAADLVLAVLKPPAPAWLDRVDDGVKICAMVEALAPGQIVPPADQPNVESTYYHPLIGAAQALRHWPAAACAALCIAVEWQLRMVRGLFSSNLSSILSHFTRFHTALIM